MVSCDVSRRCGVTYTTKKGKQAYVPRKYIRKRCGKYTAKLKGECRAAQISKKRKKKKAWKPPKNFIL